MKTALVRTQEVLVGGLHGGGGAAHRDLRLAAARRVRRRRRLRYLGHVGTGFSDAVLVDLMARLRPLARPTSPFDEVVPREHARKARWVEPVLVGEVEYRLVTRDGRLRHAAWRGLRPDRAPDVGADARRTGVTRRSAELRVLPGLARRGTRDRATALHRVTARAVETAGARPGRRGARDGGCRGVARPGPDRRWSARR